MYSGNILKDGHDPYLWAKGAGAVKRVLTAEAEWILPTTAMTTEGVLTTHTVMAFNGIPWTKCVVAFDGILGTKCPLVV